MALFKNMSIVCNKHGKGTKNTFSLIKYQLLESEMVTSDFLKNILKCFSSSGL